MKGSEPIGRLDLISGELEENRVTASVLRPIARGEGLTVILSLPSGTFDPPLPPRSERQVGSTERAPTFSPPPQSRPVAWLAAIIGIPAFLYPFYRRNHPSLGPLVVRFDPPDGLEAPESGTLIDGAVNPHDIVAGIISLAQKGALKLRKSPEHANRMIIEMRSLNHNTSNLTEFERGLHRRLNTFGTTITPDALHGEFGEHYSALSNELNSQMYRLGYFQRVNPGLGSSCFFLLFMVALTAYFSFSYGCVAILIGAIVMAVGVRLLGNPSPLTYEGHKARHHLQGLKEFITRANQKELNYMSERMPDQALFERLLPYAVAFGAVKQWAEAFQGLNIAPPDWIDDSGFADSVWIYTLVHDLDTVSHDYSDSMSYVPPVAATTAPTTSYDSGEGFSSGASGFGGLIGGGESDSGGWGGFDSSSGSFDSGGSVGDGGGGGGGDSW